LQLIFGIHTRLIFRKQTANILKKNNPQIIFVFRYTEDVARGGATFSEVTSLTELEKEYDELHRLSTTRQVWFWVFIGTGVLAVIALCVALKLPSGSNEDSDSESDSDDEGIRNLTRGSTQPVQQVQQVQQPGGYQPGVCQPSQQPGGYQPQQPAGYQPQQAYGTQQGYQQQPAYGYTPQTPMGY
jgi:hypothetical protein